MQKYPRGSRGSPAKGVVWENRSTSSNLVFCAKKGRPRDVLFLALLTRENSWFAHEFARAPSANVGWFIYESRRRCDAMSEANNLVFCYRENAWIITSDARRLAIPSQAPYARAVKSPRRAKIRSAYFTVMLCRSRQNLVFCYRENAWITLFRLTVECTVKLRCWHLQFYIL